MKRIKRYKDYLGCKPPQPNSITVMLNDLASELEGCNKHLELTTSIVNGMATALKGAEKRILELEEVIKERHENAIIYGLSGCECKICNSTSK